MMKRSDFVLMAPAGSWESLSAAIDAGANAVYFGLGELDMRSRASGAFGLGDLPEIVSRCHSCGVKTYMTVNSVIYDGDLPRMRELVDAAKAAGISAVIASDAAVLQYCLSQNVSVHLSTQLNISNIEALRFYAQFADAVVLARELTLEQTAQISRQIVQEDIRGPSGDLVKIEMFCHGALCMAISGKCYLSLHTRGRSANRGDCMQSCRRRYILKDADRDVEIGEQGGYFLSPKDLKTIDFIDQMMVSGVTIFKIEGRARGADYVRVVTEAYDEAMRAVVDGRWDKQVAQSFDERLSKVYNRGFWSGWYLGRTTAELSLGYGSEATEKKVYAGKAVNYYSRGGIGDFLLQAEVLRDSERVLITGPTTGAIYTEAKGLRADGQPAQVALKGQRATFEVPVKVRQGDKLYVLRPSSGTQPDKPLKNRL